MRSEDSRQQPAVKDHWQREDSALSASALAFYAVLTALVAAGVLLTTVYLGQQPRLRAGADTQLPDGWLWVTESSNDFLLSLPESWRLIDPESAGGEARLKSMIANRPAWQAATKPLGALDEELSFLFLAQGQVPPDAAGGAQAVLIVAQSRLLNQLAPAEIVAVAEELADENEMVVVESDLVAAIPGLEAERAALVVDSAPTGADEPLRCRQQLIPGRLSLMLVTACTRPESQYQSTVARIMASFQRLAP